MPQRLSIIIDNIRILVFAVLLAMSCASMAAAHALLNASVPPDGSVVAEAPQAYLLTFSEPVSPLMLRILKPDGTSALLDQFKLKDQTLEISAPEGLGRGTHVLSWRVVSADGHPVGGSIVFSIGAASTETHLVKDEIDWTVRLGVWFFKVLLYIGLFIGVGGIVAIRVLMPSIGAGRHLMIVALMLGAIGAVLSIGSQGLDALGASAGHFFEPRIWLTGLSTTYGWTVWAALSAFALAGLALRARNFAKVFAVLALVASGTALALSGHASAASPQWLMRPTVFMHGVGILVWIGALLPLSLSFKRHEPGATLALCRFSRFIPAWVVLLVIAGSILAVVQLERPSALWDTAYGRIFLAKLALLSGLFFLAAFNRWQLTRQVKVGGLSATRRLVRSVLVEVTFALMIFGAAAAWRFTPPPRALAVQTAAPATAHMHGEKAVVNLAVRSGQAGLSDIVANILNGESAPLEVKEVVIVFSNPNVGIEPFKRRLERSSAGDWHIKGVMIPLQGLWRVRIDLLINDFDVIKLDGEIMINTKYHQLEKERP